MPHSGFQFPPFSAQHPLTWPHFLHFSHSLTFTSHMATLSPPLSFSYLYLSHGHTFSTSLILLPLPLANSLTFTSFYLSYLYLFLSLLPLPLSISLTFTSFYLHFLPLPLSLSLFTLFLSCLSFSGPSCSFEVCFNNPTLISKMFYPYFFSQIYAVIPSKSCLL